MFLPITRKEYFFMKKKILFALLVASSFVVNHAIKAMEDDDTTPMDIDCELQLSSRQIAQKVSQELSVFTKKANKELAIVDAELESLHEERKRYENTFLLADSKNQVYKSFYVKDFQERLAPAQKKRILNKLIAELKNLQRIILTELAKWSSNKLIWTGLLKKDIAVPHLDGHSPCDHYFLYWTFDLEHLPSSSLKKLVFALHLINYNLKYFRDKKRSVKNAFG